MAKYVEFVIQSLRSFTDSSKVLHKQELKTVWEMRLPKWQSDYWKMGTLAYEEPVLTTGSQSRVALQKITGFTYPKEIQVWDPTSNTWNRATKQITVPEHTKSVATPKQKAKKDYYKIHTGQKTAKGNKVSQFYAFHRSFSVFEVSQILACFFEAADPDIQPKVFWSPSGSQHPLVYPATFNAIADANHTAWVVKPQTPVEQITPAAARTRRTGQPTTKPAETEA